MYDEKRKKLKIYFYFLIKGTDTGLVIWPSFSCNCVYQQEAQKKMEIAALEQIRVKKSLFIGHPEDVCLEEGVVSTCATSINEPSSSTDSSMSLPRVKIERS